MRIVAITGGMGDDARLARMFEHRHQVFVERLGWSALARADFLERDDLDGPDAVYLLAEDSAGRLRGSVRLLRTTGPHLFSATFAAFLGPEHAPAPDVWEWSRHAPGHPDWSPDVNAAARAALHLGVCEFGLARGVSAFVALIETRLVRHARRLGWDCAPIGPPMAYAEGEAIAVRNTVNVERLARLRRATGVTCSILRRDAAEATRA